MVLTSGEPSLRNTSVARAEEFAGLCVQSKIAVTRVENQRRCCGANSSECNYCQEAVCRNRTGANSVGVMTDCSTADICEREE